MPSSLASVFAAAGSPPMDAVRWRERVPSGRLGVYVVALTADVQSLAAARMPCPVSVSQVETLLDRRPGLSLDGSRPTAAQLTERIGAFWLPDEVVLYVGLTCSALVHRVDDYYATPLGAARPHRGGWWLKTLNILDQLFVHYLEHPDPEAAENRMLAAFSAAVSERSRGRLHDPDRPIPFANLEWPKGRIKKHGLRGATEPRGHARRASPPASSARGDPPLIQREWAAVEGVSHHSQAVNEGDLRHGRIRIPQSAKELFPEEPGTIEVVIRGERFRCRWNARSGPKTRSGELGLGVERARRLLVVGDVLRLTRTADVISLA